MILKKDELITAGYFLKGQIYKGCAAEQGLLDGFIELVEIFNKILAANNAKT